MPLAAVALLLAAAVAHAGWNYLAKGARNDLAFQCALVVCSSIIYAPIALAAWLFARPDLDPAGWGFVAISGVFHLTYYFLLTRGYQVGDLSLVYPLARGTGPVFAVIGGIVIYGEEPTLLALAGAALVVAGIIFMSWPRETHGGAELRLSIVFAVATGMCTAVYTLWDKTGVDLLTPVLYGYGLEVVRVAYLAPFALRTASGRRAVAATFREQRRAVIGIGVLTPLAYMLVLAALSIAPVSYVAPAREISILLGTLLGWRLLGEEDVVRRTGGAVAIVVGVFALALG